MKVTKFAQSCCLIETSDGTTILIDPGRYSEVADLLAQMPRLNTLIITHEHEDHFSRDHIDALLSAHPGLRLITNSYLSGILQPEGKTVRSVEVGEKVEVGSCVMRIMPTDHVAQERVIPNFGLLLEDHGKIVYHMSDTRYLLPDSLSIKGKIDLLLIPISNRGLVMGMDDAAHFASQLHPRLVVPIHYDSPKDRDRVDPAMFLQMLDRYGLQGKILDHGQMIEV